MSSAQSDVKAYERPTFLCEVGPKYYRPAYLRDIGARGGDRRAVLSHVTHENLSLSHKDARRQTAEQSFYITDIRNFSKICCLVVLGSRCSSELTLCECLARETFTQLAPRYWGIAVHTCERDMSHV